jgi:succinate dehydrogenase/fumarate reductase flavoprotein subunit
MVNESRAFDVVVIGAGTAGLSFAISAAEQRLKVAVVEQLTDIGGTLHRTSGFMSAAGTKQQLQKGIHSDSKEQHTQDVLRVARRNYDLDMVNRAVDAAPDFIDWLDGQDFRFHEESPGIYYGHEPYLVPRTYWGSASGMSLLEVFRPLWNSHVTSGQITPFLGHSLGELIWKDESVVGVTVVNISNSEVFQIEARRTVLATGGFGSNEKMYMEETGRTTRPLSASLPGNTGAGHEVALELGAKMRHGREILRIGHFALATHPNRADLSIRGDFDALVRRPREIWVNRQGNRFTDESIEVNTEHEHILLDQDEQTLWAIFDQVALQSGQSLIRGWVPSDFVKSADQGSGIVYMGGSLVDLAEQAGLPANQLVATVANWNMTVKENSEWAKWTQMPIESGPFYAVRCQGTILTTFSGICTDQAHHVIRDDGNTITNLYAIGEIMGVAAWSGESWPSGMCLTPSLSLGRLLAKELASGICNSQS